jgi:hypothetical protein
VQLAETASTVVRAYVGFPINFKGEVTVVTEYTDDRWASVYRPLTASVSGDMKSSPEDLVGMTYSISAPVITPDELAATRAAAMEREKQLVEEAAKHEAEDKAMFEKVEAKNKLEAYLYGVRNTLEEKKDSYGENGPAAVECVKAALEWLEANQDAVSQSKEVYEAKQKEVETAIHDVMLFLQVSDHPRVKEARAKKAAEDAAAAASGSASADAGPKIEEVD